MGPWRTQRHGDLVAIDEAGQLVMLCAALEVVGQEPPPATRSLCDEPSRGLTGLPVAFREVANEVHRVRPGALDGDEPAPREPVCPQQADANDAVRSEARMTG